MRSLDWIVLGLYFLLIVAIGLWSYKRVSNTSDFFTAGGKMPWWLAGISHHVSGYSVVVFTAYAAIAYELGFTMYVWWAFTIGVTMFPVALFVAPRWARLRERLGIQSPTEYLKTRYNLPTQQLIAWVGVALKVFDVAAKFAGTAIILTVLAGIPLWAGTLISAVVMLFYVTIGGLWADVLTDFGQFLVQATASIALFVGVLIELGGIDQIFGVWDRLPDSHSDLFAGEYTPAFVLGFSVLMFLQHAGGQWNLAQRLIASPRGSDARKASYVSGALSLVFPLILFFPAWVAPIFFPNLENPENSYALMAQEFLPTGMLGLVLASMFAATQAMVASDCNAISAVFTRDILPHLGARFRSLSRRSALVAARVTTFVFTAFTVVVAVWNDAFGGILDLVLVWYLGLVGPTAAPLVLGLFPAFRRSGPAAALVSWAAGTATFALAKIFDGPMAATNGLPVVVSSVVFCLFGIVTRRSADPAASRLLTSISTDTPAESEPAGRENRMSEPA